jgi:hypothetical protein
MLQIVSIGSRAAARFLQYIVSPEDIALLTLLNIILSSVLTMLDIGRRLRGRQKSLSSLFAPVAGYLGLVPVALGYVTALLLVLQAFGLIEILIRPK